MIELCMSPLLPAIFAGLCGWFVFLRGKAPRAYPGRAASFPSISANDARKLSLPLLEEIVREAEERMKAQESIFRSHERKALLLATLSIIMLGHLSNGEPFADYRSGAAAVWMLVAFLPLALSAALCMRAIDFTAYSPPGFPPYVGGYVLGSADKNGKDGDLQYLLCHLLEEYDKRIEDNEKSNHGKYLGVFKARQFWVVGTTAYLGMLGGNSEILKSICCMGG